MMPWLHDPDLDIWLGDVRQVLPQLPADSVDCALTSPPFYALRDYGVDGQIGLEATPEEWVDELVDVFREVRRILKPAGTLWIECGDSYNAYNGNRGLSGTTLEGTDRPEARPKLPAGAGLTSAAYKPKDLLLQPFMLAIALRADGWYLRQIIVWHKPNAMPESVRDRCTTAHSYVLLLSKQQRYWFDGDAISEPAEWARWGDQTVPKYEGTDTSSGWIQPKTKAELRARSRDGDWQSGGLENGKSTWPDGRQTGGPSPGATKNARSVWTIPTEGYAEAHFATWPQVLVERILKAGCPEHVCKKCGKARERQTESSYSGQAPDSEARIEAPMVKSFGGRADRRTETTGWTDCGCNAGYTAGTCLDPFLGLGTTALVARRLGRRTIGVELNQQYAHMAARRLQQLSLLA